MFVNYNIVLWVGKLTKFRNNVIDSKVSKVSKVSFLSNLVT